jgi:hypothetical protein
VKRLVAALVVLAAARDARADSYAETWVGTWSGAATWKGCTAGGADDIELRMTWRDAMLFVDGSGLYEGLGDMAPDVRAGDVLVFETDDLKLELKPPTKKRKKATIKLTTAAQCTMTAKLTRSGGTGIAACDGLAALTEVAKSCEVDAGEALTKPTQKACSKRAAALRESLLGERCLPSDDDARDIPECREVWSLAQRIARCTSAPAGFQQKTREHVGDLRRQLRLLDADDAVLHCTESASALRDSADVLRCP